MHGQGRVIAAAAAVAHVVVGLLHGHRRLNPPIVICLEDSLPEHIGHLAMTLHVGVDAIVIQVGPDPIVRVTLGWVHVGQVDAMLVPQLANQLPIVSIEDRAVPYAVIQATGNKGRQEDACPRHIWRVPDMREQIRHALLSTGDVDIPIGIICAQVDDNHIRLEVARSVEVFRSLVDDGPRGAFVVLQVTGLVSMLSFITPTVTRGIGVSPCRAC